MKCKKIIQRMVVVCTGVVLAFSLVACNSQKTENADQVANRQYMTQVNQTMDDLTARLATFTDAVARGDVVTIRTQADNAFKTISSLNSIEAPEAMKDIQTAYVEGCESLEGALNDYIALYTEIESATDAQPFDYSSYDGRIQAIQAKYDAGIEKLQSADTLATEKN